jgi:hypothetical protein
MAYSGRTLARFGRTAARSATSGAPAAAALPGATLPALVAIRLSGVTSRMSHKAASTASDSRSGGAADQPVHLGRRQPDPALGQQWHQFGRGEHAPGRHLLPQPPLVADLPPLPHRCPPAVPAAPAIVWSSAVRRVRVR